MIKSIECKFSSSDLLLTYTHATLQAKEEKLIHPTIDQFVLLLRKFFNYRIEAFHKLRKGQSLDIIIKKLSTFNLCHFKFPLQDFEHK
jgi:hypothetical protein